MSLLWAPQEKQRAFMQRPEYEALYGGAAGGGKSEALVIEALRQIQNPRYKGLILRKSYPQLSELIEKSQRYYKAAYPGAKYNAGSHTWLFPSGAKIAFGSLARDGDLSKYQGLSFDFIAFDELTHFTFREYSYMFSRNRPNGKNLRCYIRATANPGGVGHGWVKERFIDPAPPGTPIREEVSWTLPDGTVKSGTRSRIFIPASVYDNAELLKNDPDYPARLASLPEAEKKAFLYGDWTSFSGQVFPEWRNFPGEAFSHTVHPFAIPPGWKIVRSFDFGYSRPFSVGWYALSGDGVIYRFRELYGCSKRPNEGVKWEPAKIAREITRIENDDLNIRGKRVVGVADPSIFDESRGESVAGIMEKEGVYFERGDNSRIAGKMQVHERLRFDDMGRCGLYVFETCRAFIRTFPSLVYDENDVEDVDTECEDHIYDELRYALMRYPLRKQKEEKYGKTGYYLGI